MRGLSGDAFTLIVDRIPECLTVPRGLPEAIPYFNTALNGPFEKISSQILNFPDFEAAAVADAIVFVYDRKIRSLPDGSHWEDVKILKSLKHTVSTYIIAYAWDLESMQNSIVDNFKDYLVGKVVHPELLVMLRESDLESSALYGQLVHGFTTAMMNQYLGGFTTGLDTRPGVQINGSFRQACASLGHDDFLEILCASRTIRRTISATTHDSPYSGRVGDDDT